MHEREAELHDRAAARQDQARSSTVSALRARVADRRDTVR